MKTLEELNKEIKRKIEELDELNVRATLLGRLSCEMSNEMVNAFSAYMYYWDINPVDVDDNTVSHFRKSYVGYFESSYDLYERFVDYRYYELSQLLLSNKFYKVKNYYFK